MAKSTSVVVSLRLCQSTLETLLINLNVAWPYKLMCNAIPFTQNNRLLNRLSRSSLKLSTSMVQLCFGITQACKTAHKHGSPRKTTTMAIARALASFYTTKLDYSSRYLYKPLTQSGVSGVLLHTRITPNRL